MRGVEEPDVVEEFRELTAHTSGEALRWYDQLSEEEQKTLLLWTCSWIQGLREELEAIVDEVREER